MSQLHQMQITYVPVEDRLLFRVNTKHRQEFRFWMTRRYVKLTWNGLLDLLKKREAPKEKAPDAPSQGAVLEQKHKEAVEKSDFKTQYQESSYLPLGEQPTLLFSIGVKNGPEGNSILCMHPQKGDGLEMALNDQIIHSLCQLLSDATKKADWDLQLDFAKAKKYLGKQGLN